MFRCKLCDELFADEIIEKLIEFTRAVRGTKSYLVTIEGRGHEVSRVRVSKSKADSIGEEN